MSTNILETRRMNKIRIARFVSMKGSTSKAEIAASLNLSMPTTLQNVKELVEAGIVAEEGEYESTGGRKAKALSIVKSAAYAVGVDITRNHVTMVMVNARKEISLSERVRRPFENSMEYYEYLEKLICEFIQKAGILKEKIAGIGFSLPGIVDREQKLLMYSHVLQVDNISFKNLGNSLGFCYTSENDASSAAYAELHGNKENAVYLSLSSTVGGAIYLDGQLYRGENFKSAEFGHMVIVKDGKRCYCGKKGCADVYCSADIFQQTSGSLDTFFQKLREKDERVRKIWEEYLDHLAVVIGNLRMLFDCNVVLGGYVGGYLKEFMPELAKKVLQHNSFDLDTSYLKAGTYKLEASAYGAALEHIDAFFERITSIPSL